MSNPSLAETWITPPKDGRRFAAAIGIGLLLEGAALGLLLPWMAHQVPPASNAPARVKLSIISPAPPASLKAPAPPKPVVRPPPVPMPPPPPMPVVPPAPVPPPLPRPAAHHPVRHVPRPLRNVMRAPAPPRPPAPLPPPAPPPSASAAPNTDELAQFAAAMHRALQNALIFPDSAQMAHEYGVVRIEFNYLNGVVSDITVIRSCGFPELDHAAVQTARIAHYPLPPSNFAGHTEAVDVDVVFPQAAPTADSD